MPPSANAPLRPEARRVLRWLGRSILRRPEGDLARFFEAPAWRDARASGLTPRRADALASLGLVLRRGARLLARARVQSCEGLAIAHEVDRIDGPAREDVMGVGPNARVLARFTPRDRHARVLEVGCGQGFAALLAARHAARTIATDVSRHALRLAAVNAAMNGSRRVDFRRGHLFEPVRSETFDLIVSNPPFIFSPVHQVRSGGDAARGDALVQALIRQCPRHLRPDGLAVLICNWEHADADRWEAAPRAWVRAGGCDAWIVRFATHRPDDVLLALGEPARAADREPLRRWRQHVIAARVSILTVGLVFLRRTSGPAWVRCDTLELADAPDHAGEQVRRVFNNTTLLEREGPDALLDRRYRPADTLRVVTGTPGTPATLEHAAGFRFETRADPDVLRFLDRLDGPRTARAAARLASGSMHAAHAPAVLRELLRRGFVVPSARARRAPIPLPDVPHPSA